MSTFEDQLREQFKDYKHDINIVLELNKIMDKFSFDIDNFIFIICINDIYTYGIDLDQSDNKVLNDIEVFNSNIKLIEKIFTDKKKYELFDLISYGFDLSDRNIQRLYFVDKIPDQYVEKTIEVIKFFKNKDILITSVTLDNLIFEKANINSSYFVVKLNANNIYQDLFTANLFIGNIKATETLKDLEEE